MSQTYKDDCYTITDLVAGTTSNLQEIENNFTTLKGSFSGSSVPSGGDYTVVAGLTWYDTTNLQLKYRNAANNGWMYFFPGDASSKVWAYRNDAVEGMVVDTSVTDKVLAIKGGSQDYNVNGGNTAGNWTLNHTHGDGSYSVNTYHRHQFVYDQEGWFYYYGYYRTDFQGSTTQAVVGTSATGAPTSVWRPASAVGVLLKPDL